jgi:hypothetical protein
VVTAELAQVSGAAAASGEILELGEISVWE